MAKAAPKKGKTEAQEKATAGSCPDLCTICEDQNKGQLLMCDGAGNVVLTPAPTVNGQTLVWNATTGTWVASNVPPPPPAVPHPNRTGGPEPAGENPDTDLEPTTPDLPPAPAAGMKEPVLAWKDGRPAWVPFESLL